MWDHFKDLFSPGGIGMGPTLLSYGEMESYSRMTREQLTPYESRLLRALSIEYVSVYGESLDKKTGSQPSVSAAASNTNKPIRLISMKDSKGLKEFFTRLGDRAAPRTKTK